MSLVKMPPHYCQLFKVILRDLSSKFISNMNLWFKVLNIHFFSVPLKEEIQIYSAQVWYSFPNQMQELWH